MEVTQRRPRIESDSLVERRERVVKALQVVQRAAEVELRVDVVWIQFDSAAKLLFGASALIGIEQFDPASEVCVGEHRADLRIVGPSGKGRLQNLNCVLKAFFPAVVRTHGQVEPFFAGKSRESRRCGSIKLSCVALQLVNGAKSNVCLERLRLGGNALSKQTLGGSQIATLESLGT